MADHRNLILIFLLTPSIMLCQQSVVKFDHISAEQGLSHLTVTKIVQDKKGFLWVGTEHGLNRYDGFTFTTYYPDAADSNAIGGFVINELAVDTEGALWIVASSGGLTRYDADADRFVRHRPPAELPGSDKLVVGPVCAGQDGSIWFGSDQGLWLYDRRNNQYEKFSHRPRDLTSISSDHISSLCTGPDGTVWVGTDSGLNRYEAKYNQFQRYSYASHDPKAPGENVIVSIVCDREKVVWVGSGGGLSRVDDVHKTLIPQSHPLPEGGNLGTASIQALVVDAQGQLWIGTRSDGIVKRDPVTGKIEQFRHDPKNPRSLDQDRVNCIYQDRSGVLWVGTYRGGLNKHDPRQDEFVHYSIEGETYALFEDTRGDLWVGTYENGLLHYSGSSGKVTPYRHDPRKSASIANNIVRAIQEDDRGDIWVGTGEGLDRFSRVNGTFTHYDLARLFSGKVYDRGIKAIYIDHDDELWIGTVAMGLARYDRRKNSFVLYSHNPRDTTSLSGNGVWALFDDGQGGLWVGTFGNGLDRFDKATQKFVRIPDYSTAAIYSVYGDNKGYLWVGTFGYGLLQLDMQGHPVRQFATCDGLPDDYVKGILDERNGNFWLSTDKGLAKLNLSTGAVRVFKESDGLLGNIFLSGASFRGHSGIFYFGGEGGVTAFNPDSIRERSYQPETVITRFTVLEKPFPLGNPIKGTTHISLSYDQNFFSFEFVAFDYTSPPRNQYAYMLEGVDKGWINAGTRRYANYTNVPPGSYTFRVKASNSDGVWASVEGTSAQVVIAPPFWATWWFRIGAVLVIGTLAVMGYNYRVQRLLGIERLRVRIASDLHDEIGSSLTRISLQSELMREGVDKGDMNSQLIDIARMSRDLVTTMSDIVWSIDARNDTLENLLLKMRDFASSTLSAKQVELSFTHSGLDLKKKIAVDKRENIYLIYKEAINNIARHSDATEVRVVLRNDHDKFTMVVVENGKGWDGNARPAGNGIRNMRMRAERLGGNIDFVRDEGVRSVLTLKPL